MELAATKKGRRLLVVPFAPSLQPTRIDDHEHDDDYRDHVEDPKPVFEMCEWKHGAFAERR
jgi:hypothetical protein